MAKQTKKEFQVTLTLGDKKYKARAEDLQKALLALKPEKISAKAVFSVEYDGKKVEMQRHIFQTRRIVTKEFDAFIFSRNLMTRLS